MIKKSLLVFSIISLGISGLFLTGCKEEEDSKVCLTYGHIYKEDIESITSLPELNYEDLKSKIAHQDSFLLAMYNSTCSCWTDFGPVLTEFINKYHVNVEYIEVTQVQNQSEKYGLHTVKGDMPSISIFRKGLLVDQQVYGINDTKIFRDVSHFESYIDSKVYLPKMYYVEKDYLDDLFNSNQTFNLYVGRSECPDCQALDKNVLRVWNEEVKTVNDNLYIFDIQSYYASSYAGSTEEEIAAYQALKDYLGLSNKNNTNLGYETGMVPTLQRRTGSSITDMAVLYNDSINKDTKKVVSYFTSDRVEKMHFMNKGNFTKVLNGMSLSDEQVANWRSSYRDEFYTKYHDPIAKAFLNTYVK